MNNIRSTAAINARELELGGKGSWHDEYKDSAYIYIGGLDNGLTEGDVIAIFSQYGEPIDINMPKDKSTAKPRGFAFLMYEDQRSTNLAVDNLNGAQVLGRTLRVDHVKNYKQLERGEDGKMRERDADEGERLNARPELHLPPPGSSEEDEDDDDDNASFGSIDPEDPMAAYLIEQKRAEKKAQKEGVGKKDKGKKRKHEGETKEVRRARKEAKRLKKLLREVGPSTQGRGRDQDERRSARRNRDAGERSDGRGGRRSRSRSLTPRAVDRYGRQERGDKDTWRDDNRRGEDERLDRRSANKRSHHRTGSSERGRHRRDRDGSYDYYDDHDRRR